MSSGPRSLGDSAGIRCVALDAVGTVMFAEPSVSAAYAEFGQRFGSCVSAAEVRERFAPALRHAEELSQSRFGESGRTDEESERLFWERVVADILPDVADASGCFEALFEHFARPESWRCFEDVEPTVTELRRRGYRIVIASNFDARLHRVCDGFRELRELTTRVISSLVGYRKTHIGFYRELVSVAECSSNEILMVGDDFENDVASAERSGLRAIHLDRSFASDLARTPPPIRSLTELLEFLP